VNSKSNTDDRARFRPLSSIAVAAAGLLAGLNGVSSFGSPPLYAQEPAASADVIVVGATPGGIAAAVAAARLGRSVILVEYENHIGGVVTNGLTNADIGKRQAVGGLYYEFTRRVVKHYQWLDRDDPKSPNVKACSDGYSYEASLAETLFQDLLAEERPRIDLRLRNELKQAIVVDGRLTGIVVAEKSHKDRLARIDGKVFVDATYEGDLAAMAGAPYRIGRESRDEFGEPHAGKIYLRFGTNELLPGSTGEADRATEAYCFRFHVTNVPENRAPIKKPTVFDRDDYREVLEQIAAGKVTRFRQVIQLIPMPRGKFELNSDHPDPMTGVPSESLDLAEENWAWPEASQDERRKIFARYLSHNVGLVWLLQNDPEVPQKIRDDALQYGWCRDEWKGKSENMPRQIYVRQGRRVMGDYVLTERDAELDSQLGRTKVQPTSIGIVEWAFDPHGCHKYDPSHPGVREGYAFINHEPFQIPYGVIVPQKIDGLLVPVACSCSHVAYNAIRMEPVFVALGEASGIAAHLAIRDAIAVRRAPVPELQKLLVSRRGVITFFQDLKFDDPAFPAFQWLGARGFNTGYAAEPEAKLTRRDGWTRLERVLKAEGKSWLLPDQEPDAELRGLMVVEWLRQAGYSPPDDESKGLDDQPLKIRQFATLVYAIIAGHGQ
jgi:hypothetical protein